MVDRIGPANAVQVAGVDTPKYDARWERQLRGVHQVMGASTRPLGARTGVRPGTPTTTVTATATQWTCQAFAGDADVEAAAEAGAYPFAFDAVATGAMTPADGSNSRVDILYVQVDDGAEDGSSGAPTVTRKYLAGTAGSGVAPAPPVSRAFVIAQINVPKSGTGSPSVTWVAPYTAGAGGVVPFIKLADLNLWTPPQALQLAAVFGDSTNNGHYQYLGGSWQPLGHALGWGGSVKRGAGTPNLGAVWNILNTAAYWTTDQAALGVAPFNGAWVAPIDGVYDVELQVATTTAVNGFVAIKRNSTSADAVNAIAINSFLGNANLGSGYVRRRVRLAAGDSLVAAIYCTAATAWNTAAENSFFGIRYVEPLR